VCLRSETAYFSDRIGAPVQRRERGRARQARSEPEFGARYRDEGKRVALSVAEGALQERVHRWMWRSFGLFLVAFVWTTMFTLVRHPHVIDNFARLPWLWAVPALLTLAIANVPRAIFKRQPGYAFLSSSATILGLVVLLGVALFPNLVRSVPEAAHSLTLWNAASSQRTLRIMLWIALLGMPMVLAYTAVVYWTFRGKVQLGEHSY